MINTFARKKNNSQAQTEETVSVITPPTERPNYGARVGLFAWFAFLLLSGGWGWLKGIGLHPPQRFTVSFHDVEGLNNNAPVNVSGVRVGNVEKIELTNAAPMVGPDGKPSTVEKPEHLVLVHLKINTENVRVPLGSTFTIQTLGMVGAKYVEITLPDKPISTSADSLLPQSDQGFLTENAPPVKGQDPVRYEMYLNTLFAQIKKLDIPGIQENMNATLISAQHTFDQYRESAPELRNVAKTLDRVANKADSAVSSANAFFTKGSDSMGHITSLADDMKVTTKRASAILANPNLSADLKQTAESARQASANIQKAMSELNKTIGDKDVRGDMQGMLERIQTSTDNIAKSIQTVNKLAGDQGLRSDLKEVVTKANTALDKVNGVVSHPDFAGDVKTTMEKVRNAATDLDEAAKNINKRVSGKHWLLGGMVGGGLKEKTKKVKTDKNGNKEVTTEETKVTGTKQGSAPANKNGAATQDSAPVAAPDRKE